MSEWVTDKGSHWSDSGSIKIKSEIVSIYRYIHESKHYLIMTIYGTLWMKREGVGIVNPAEKNVKFQAKDIFDICCMTGHSHCKT